MKEQHNIERLFQEKFKDFEATPRPEVWESIEAKLTKKKRRVLPMWWFSGGVAATLVLGFLFYPYVIEQEIINGIDTDVVETTTKELKTKQEKEENLFKEDINNNETLVVEETIKKEELKEKLLPNEVLTTNHVVKISKNELLKEKNNSVSKVVEGALLAETTVVKNEAQTGKFENNLPVILKKEAQENLSKEKDSLSNTKKQEFKPKKDLIAEVEKENDNSKEDKEIKRWSVAPVFAIVKANSFSKDSPLDSKLIPTPTNGSNNFSYGVKVAYQFNNRWEIQSGVQIQKVDYTNDNVPITTSFSSSDLSSVDYNDEFSSFGFGTGTSSGFGILSTGFGVINENATLTQSLGYIEVPVEVKYAFINTEKFSTKVVTGFSSLFLNKNEVSVSSEKISETFGSIKNLNSVDFSGNLGVEFDYSISKQLKFNLNPMFKVQFNTFSSESNGFKPYTLGLYSGIKYQF